ncbi:undecaprenyl/decaprenyl-phosphate alpha-N-acetylglucosaminyl 1-phosphate transferase [Bacteroidia bacterium]|nr:undecaprenyl/decaprenyl-phosphate alpha-N-acetylglucosaminyl 1-phosphate transferase [Bacteroidia bacterium]
MKLYYYISIFVSSFLLTWYIIPLIRAVSIKNRLIQFTNYRSSHKKIVPSFGGLAFFLVLMIGVLITPEIIEKVFNECKLGYINSMIMRALILISLIIITYTGIKDDNKILSPVRKLLGQSASAGLIVCFKDFRIQSLYGLFGIYDIPLDVSIIISIVFIVAFINAFNLIDGIDGNAAINGISTSFFFCFFFYHIESMFFLGFCIMIIGTLSAFLRYNFSNTKKIFMGDTGSLTIGLVLSILAIRILNIQDFQIKFDFMKYHDLPIMVFTILFLPIIDVVRVVVIRIINNKAIYKPDRNHIHHALINIGFSHRRASIVINTLNILFTYLVFLTLNIYGTLAGILVIILITILLLIFLDSITRKSKLKENY